LGETTYPALDLRFVPGPGAGSLQDFLYAELDAFEPLAIQEHESGDGWRVFFRTRAQRNAARAALRAEFGPSTGSGRPELVEGRNALVDLSPVDVPDEDWARRSQANLTAVRVGRIVVAPPWDVPTEDSRAPDVVVVIEPSTGFGTGHHATTRLCLELLQGLDVIGRRVIDVGTGSGVLAIAAAKLGAASVLALDNDPDALRSARENVARNGVDVDVREGDLACLDAPAADIVLANLTSAVLRRLAGSLARLAAPDGAVILSGFAPDESPGILSDYALAPVKETREGGWAAILLRK
jgi:ribosomal protein L11 methyltransferase